MSYFCLGKSTNKKEMNKWIIKQQTVAAYLAYEKICVRENNCSNADLKERVTNGGTDSMV
jgi:hypothetical protein